MQEIYDNYKDMVYKIAHGVCPNSNDVDDYAQHAFLHILENKKKYDKTRSGKITFVHMLAIQSMLKLRKKESRPKTSILQETLSYHDVVSELDLCPFYRKIVDMKSSGYTVKEIKKEMGITEGKYYITMNKIRSEVEKDIIRQ